MKERIKELARQSGGIDITNHTAGGVTVWVGTGTPEFLEKFAELIVRECAEVGLDSVEDGDDLDAIMKRVHNNILKHFEVE